MVMYSSRTVFSLWECGCSRGLLWELFFFTSASRINGGIRWGLRWYFHLVLFEHGPACMIDFFVTYLFVRFSETVEVLGITLSLVCLEETSSIEVILITFIKTANTLLIQAKIFIS